MYYLYQNFGYLYLISYRLNKNFVSSSILKYMARLRDKTAY